MEHNAEVVGRSSGVLLHVTSLPGPFGIGDLGRAASAWVSRLGKAGQTWWQILPLGPPGEGNSPYGCLSAFAGSPDLISPEALRDDGLLTPAVLKDARFPAGRVNFGKVRKFKQAVLQSAWQTFRSGGRQPLASDFQTFCHDEARWLNDFTRFMAIREANGNRPWTEWPRELARRTKSAMREVDAHLRESIDRHAFIQFLFDRQLKALRRHALSKGVRLIGDIPMFVAADSADVWANPHLFRLDAQGRPKVVAGVPPDYFSRTGQRWGNPLYNWPVMRRDAFAWWVDRMRAALRQVDLLRIDHFRGLEACWEIPASSPTAEKGRWAKAPGAELLRTLRARLGGLPFIAEDLGLITPAVERLRDDFNLPGMRVLQFAFGGDSTNTFLPHNYPRRAVVYTGTHDNDTVLGWFRTLSKSDRSRLSRYLPCDPSDLPAEMIRLAWSSVADVAIAALQDVMGLGSTARMNVPGKANGNWGWRLDSLERSQMGLDRLGELTTLYGRVRLAGKLAATFPA